MSVVPAPASATVAGRVVRVRSCRNGNWRIRLVETGGALAAGEIRPSNPLPLPRVGARILLRGALRYDEEHRWYTIDPVEFWIESSPPSRLFSW
jgi:hypothetical protein